MADALLQPADAIECFDHRASQRMVNFVDLLDRDRKCSKSFCDVILRSDGKELSVHKCILSCSSDYFAAMFRVEMREKYKDVIDVNVPYQRLERILQFLYAGTYILDDNNVFTVLGDAKFFQIEKLEVCCEEFLLRILSPGNCLQIRECAQRFNMCQLSEQVNSVIKEHFAELVQSEDFVDIEDMDDVYKIIRQRTKNVQKNEEALFDGLVSWVNKEDKRHETFCQLFCEVDLTCMSLQFLSSHVVKEKHVRCSLSCVQEVMDALALVSNKPVVPSWKFVAPEHPYTFGYSGNTPILYSNDRCPTTRTTKTTKHDHVQAINTFLYPEKTKHQQDVANKLDRDRQQQRFCDGKLYCDGQTFFIHKPVLMVMSPYCRQKLEKGDAAPGAVTFQDISPQRLENILDYIYTGNITIKVESLTNVLKDAETFKIPDIKSQCSAFLIESVSIDNCLRIRACAREHKLEQVLKKANRLISKNLETVLACKDVLLLSKNDVLELTDFSRTQLQEEMVFKSIVRWIKHKPTKRKKHFETMFAKINLYKVSESFLKESMATEALILSSMKCCQSLLETFSNLTSKPETSSTGFMLIGGKPDGTTCVMHNFLTAKSVNLPQPSIRRFGACAGRIGTKVFLFGGVNATSDDQPQTCEALSLDDMEQGWKQIANITIARRNAASAIVNECMYVSGGVTYGDISSFETYDPNVDAWTQLPAMLRGRSFHAMVPHRNCVYCIGGSKNGDGHSEQYDIREGKWSSIAPLSDYRWGLTAVVLKESIFAIGGDQPQIVQKYEPRANRWQEARDLNFGRDKAKSMIIADKILVVGGIDEQNRVVETMEVYDCHQDCWSPCQKFNLYRHESAFVGV